MAVTGFEIKSRSPFAGGLAFGDVGQYEQLDGSVRFAFDPDHQENVAITDLGLAPRDVRGMATCMSDFRIIRPADPAKGNGRILVDILNRGRSVALGSFNSASRITGPEGEQDNGNGFLMRHGYTVVQCGWQCDIPPGSGMRIEVPDAIGSDGPLRGKIVFTFQPNKAAQTQKIFGGIHQASFPEYLDDNEAVLTVQDHEDALPQTVSRDKWSFARLEEGRAVPDAEWVHMADGFVAGKVYQLTYRTSGSRVTGMGLLAVRDIVSFLRYGDEQDGNPCAGHVEHAYSFGVSQTGRFLRLFLYLGLNLDESGRQVFDGFMPHIGGGRRAEFNRRFAQLTSISKRTLSYLFPFTDVEQTDPGTGGHDGLLLRQTAKGGVPKIMFTNTSAEYYGSLGSLIHTNVEGTSDSTSSESVRVYHFSGTQHGAGSLPLNDTAVDGARLLQPFNIVDYRPLLRAALVNLDRWVTTGQAPPPSLHPRIDEGTLVNSEHVAATFETMPDVGYPAYLRPLRSEDYRPGLEEGAEQGTNSEPILEVGKAFTNLVAAVDEDGNELGGIRLPDISVPLATYTGWNLRHPDIGGPGQIIGLTGSTIPFPATEAIRKESGDPRLSIEERYASKEAYLDRVKVAAQALVEQGYLLEEDVETIAVQASQRFDVLTTKEAVLGRPVG